MEIKEYGPLALRTLAANVADNTIMRTWPPYACSLLNASSGVASEGGEVNEIVKKHLFHGHELDRKHLEKEIGDLMWYVNLTCYAAGIDLEQVLQTNIDKLKARYPDGFSTERSINRKEGDI